ncbi:DEAD/DEAH box helicase [Nostoc sp. MG11]|uniref:DEAD/DEAH box helicase n=1 Tax=Nostoc sp. MG11 TaxID=2721166 RepID=UPI0018667CF8|nr:DEAD/DEAH box helicase [Nostoc sp. MG11]
MTQVALTYQLRKYQRKWIKDIWNSWRNGHRRVLAQLPTGAGKTVCFAHICHEFFQQQKQVLIVAHRIELISQAAEKLELITGESVGIIKSGIPSHPERRIQVASVQTLARRKLLELPLNIGAVIFDEAHHASASSYRRLIEHYENAQILGVTATPQRIDGQGFVDLFDDLVIGETTAQLIKTGYLSKFRLFATNQTISTVGVEKYAGDFKASQLAVAVTSQIGVEQIFQNYLKYASNLRTVIFASSLEHSRALEKEFCRHGVNAEHLDGSTPSDTRVQILQRFRTGTTQVITNYEIITEGYDCPNIECIYCVRPTESSTLWLQMTGRVLRTHPLKPTAVIIDVTDNWNKHGLPDEPRQWSLSPKTIQSAQTFRLTQCEHCTHVFKPLAHEMAVVCGEIDEDGLLIQHHQATCPNCGQSVEFTTKETITPNSALTRIRLRQSFSLEITEIDLSVSGTQLEKVYDLLYNQHLNNAPIAQIYKAIFMTFIETITEFTLGDWREIVKMIEPSQPVITKKAWELYQDALVRHKNRRLALCFIEQRKLKEQINNPAPMKVTTSQTVNQLTPKISSPPESQSKSSAFKKKLGNHYFQNKYAQEWKQSLANCSMFTADFLSSNAGLFHVETTPNFVNISLEIRELPGLKSRLNEICNNTEIQKAFTLGFGKQAQVTIVRN